MLLRIFGVLASLAAFVVSSKTKPKIILVLVDDQDVHMESLKHMALLKKQMGNSVYKSLLRLSHNTNMTDVIAPYWNATWQKDQGAPVSREGTYNTDDLSDKTINYIREAHAAGKPFFIGSAPIATHSEVVVRPDTYNGTISPTDPSIQPLILPPKPAKRHTDMVRDLKLPRTPNFNPKEPNGVSWVAQRPRLNQTYVDYGDNFFRLRLESLLAVDEMVDRIFKELESLDIMDNTYIIYTSDNGYHISQHRLPPGKQCGFEEDINVPLLIRGPGVPKGVVSDAMTSHTDLAPSIFRMAGVKPRHEFDGLAVPLTGDELERASQRRAEHIGIEFWGLAADEGIDSVIMSDLNTYKGIRLHSKDYNLYYAVHCTNEHELYDMTVDPYQINNLLPSGKNGTGMPIASYAGSNVKINKKPLLSIVSRLDALLMAMKSCKGETCIKPWKVLHPDGDVNSLKDALKNKYDSSYLHTADKNSASFNMSMSGYVVTAEGPQDPSIYQGY
ncbi:arylsulfatase [Fusarium subglutinans]|uniref:Arylsulfatase n=1 Tax=Gibberella subglutinans TaxID=42677 RepID=A0A8H5L3D6_GIBSU|nr:arylsulfatase [Fusarium subglutinans]KAF5584014.1 arylsulfatase [Fusarium subglutinans]